LTETDEYQIFPSGYCRLKNADQEQQIERKLRGQLPTALKTDRVQFTNDDLALLICTSSAERLFEQSKIVSILNN
jgi:hypothetical protein